ncbi:MAG: hypothetical protein U0T84_06360 [Chitinophagales bacterium]
MKYSAFNTAVVLLLATTSHTTVHALPIPPSSSDSLTRALLQRSDSIYHQLQIQTEQNRQMILLLQQLNNRAPATAAPPQQDAAARGASDAALNALKVTANKDGKAMLESLPAPALDGIPYQYTNSAMVMLDRVESVFDARLKGMGYGGGESSVAAMGTKSAVRFTAGALPRMFIHFESKCDPSDRICLIKGETAKDRRRFVYSRVSATGQSKFTDDVRVAIKFKQVGENLWEIQLPTLTAGEYAFMVPMSGAAGINAVMSGSSNAVSKISCFGVE